MKRRISFAAGLGALVLITFALWRLSIPNMPAPRAIDWAQHAGKPTDSIHVYWVGHSLLNARDVLIDGAEDAMQMVARLARSSSLAYSDYDHTHYGASLAALWRGVPHGYDLDVAHMPERREVLQRDGQKFDAMVLTEGIPLHRSVEVEFTPYYLQTFYCTLIRQNPQARVYWYENWNSFQAGDRISGYGPFHRWDWRQRLADDLPLWNHVADLAMTGQVPSPGWWARGPRVPGAEGTGCTPEGPIFLVPVGQVMATIHDRLSSADRPENLRMPDGSPFAPLYLFQNPAVDWPADWPIPDDAPDPPDALERYAALSHLHPDATPDDVHPSQVGVYVVAVTHYAVLYRRSPIGLPTVVGVPKPIAEWIQDVAWTVVQSEPRTGVAPARR